MKSSSHVIKLYLGIGLLFVTHVVKAQQYVITTPAGNPGVNPYTTVDSTIQIPLYHPTNGATTKWGIYLTIGGGSKPALFEFDTGGTGFYAAYATDTANVSPWWGSNFSNYSSNTGTNVYDSGLTYNGNVVSTGVSFYSASNAQTALISTGNNILVGQSTNITSNSTTLWTETQSSNTNPPINGGAFYGDFGLALNYHSNSLVNIIAQMKFANGVIPGFLINAPLTGTNGFLQIGLLASQTNASNFDYFAMNPDTNNSGTFSNNPSINYKSEQIFNATMTLSNNSITYSTNIGITPDTGAVPSIHNTTNDPNFPNSLLLTNSKITLVDGVTFSLTATNNANSSVQIQNFLTTNSANETYASNLASVSVQNKGSNSTYTNYYYNAGLYFFNQHQVIYDLQNGNIGLSQSVPEPSTPWLLLLGLSVLSLLRLRKRSADRF